EKDIEKLKSDKITINEIPDYFNIISAEPVAAFPWKLISRANKRSLDWKGQARFNRSIFMVLCLLTIISCCLIKYVQNKNDQKFRAKETKYFSEYAKLALKHYMLANNISDANESGLDMSFWFINAKQDSVEKAGSSKDNFNHRAFSLV